MDLALIHIPVTGLDCFRLEDAPALQPGMEVLAGGAGGLRYGQSAGGILSVRDRDSGEGYLWKVHSAPLIKGDSGGPVMGGTGKLVGITSTGGAFGLGLPGIQWVHAHRAGALWVDQAWIRSLIAEDRRQPRGRKEAAFLMKPAPSRKLRGGGS